MANATNRANRLWQVLLWSAVAVLVVGPPAYLGVLWTRQQWTIQELASLNQPVNELSKVREKRLSRHHVRYTESLSSIAGRFMFASDTTFTESLPDLLAAAPTQPLFSPFPPLDVQIYVLEPKTGPSERNAIRTGTVEQAVNLTSRLNSLHSLHIISPGAGPLFDRKWHFRELSVEVNSHPSARNDTWKNLDLARVDRSMPRLHVLSLSRISWSNPVQFPEYGFNDLVTLELQDIATERWQLCNRRGLKYVRVYSAIKDFVVRDCPDLERLILELRELQSIEIQQLPRLKGLRLHLGASDDITYTLSDLPELETVYFSGNVRALHLKSLIEMPKLKRVRLSVSKFDAAMVDHLLKIKSMEELHLSLEKVRGNLARLAAHPSLKVVQVYVDRWEHLKKSERDRILESELNTLTLNGRIRVDRIKNLDGLDIHVLEEGERPMQNMLHNVSPFVARPAVPAATAP